MFKRLARILAVLIIPFFCFGNEIKKRYFYLKHPSCEIRLKRKNFKLKWYWETQLRKNNYKIKYISKDGRLSPGDLYLLTSVRKGSEGFKSCKMGFDLKEAKRSRPRLGDKILYQNIIKRKFPRVTFEGEERCRRAINDLMVHLPYCLTHKDRSFKK